MKECKFFRCDICGNIAGLIHNSGVRMVCCNQQMTELVANTVEASKEKHIPVATVEGNNVKVAVGSVPHPMTEEHHIVWIYLLSEQGGQRKILKAGDVPEATFALTPNDKPLAVYAYCNLHGLWKAAV
ncbi:MAG TPA: desulfoferrodoxin family protein [Bacillota bacterium]|nr:desulfoferrodoxin family protein [Bacillota bacterium]